MRKLLIAAALGLATVVCAAPATPAQPATPAMPVTPTAAAQGMPPAGMPPECADKLRAHAEKMKKELALTEAQAAAVRNEMQRFHGQLMTARADHHSAIAKILTPEQLAKMEGKHSERRQKRMEKCGADMDDDHDEAPKSKHKEKR